MSDYSDSGNNNDSDYDAQTKDHVRSRTQVGSGTGNTSSSLNETHENDPSPQKVLADYAKWTFNLKKPLLLYATKGSWPLDQQKTRKQKRWVTPMDMQYLWPSLGWEL